MNCGIYKIECIANRKCYIGASTDLLSRKNQHFNSLRKREHTNEEMQFDFNRYGEDNFYYEILELCQELNDKQVGYKHSLVSLNSDMSDTENMYIKKYDSYYHGYNKSVKIEPEEPRYSNTVLVKTHDNNFYKNNDGFYELKEGAACDYSQNKNYSELDNLRRVELKNPMLNLIKKRILEEVDRLSYNQKISILSILIEESRNC